MCLVWDIIALAIFLFILLQLMSLNYVLNHVSPFSWFFFIIISTYIIHFLLTTIKVQIFLCKSEDLKLKTTITQNFIAVLSTVRMPFLGQGILKCPCFRFYCNYCLVFLTAGRKYVSLENENIYSTKDL